MSANPGPSPEDEGLDNDLVESGNWGEIRHAIRADGTMEAKSWLENGDLKETAKFDHLFRKMAAIGKIYNEQHFRSLRDGIYEFKRDGNRILCFQHGKCWRLTHHYDKSGKRKCPPSEIDRAIAIRAEYLATLEN